MEYQITNNIDEATVWMACDDPESKVKDDIIPNKLYELIKEISPDGEEEIYIKNEYEEKCVHHLCHNGLFMKLKESEN